MSKEIQSTEDALLWRIAQMVKENVELEQRVRQLMDEYNEVVRQLRGQEKRKDEDRPSQTLGHFSQMRELCENLQVENKLLNMYAETIDSFIKDKELYMPKGICCPYMQGHPGVSSTSCLECDSCLRVLEGFGVVCRQVLYGVKKGSTKPCPPHQHNS